MFILPSLSLSCYLPPQIYTNFLVFHFLHNRFVFLPSRSHSCMIDNKNNMLYRKVLR